MDSKKDTEEDIKINLGGIGKIFKKPEEIKKEESEEKPKEDVEIDLGGITKLFKKSDEPAVEESPKTEDKDIEINFGKITGFLKKKTSNQTVQSETTKDAELDLRKVIPIIKKIFTGKGEETIEIKKTLSFLYKYNNVIMLTLGILLSILIGYSIRMESGDLTFTDSWARGSIDNALRNDISGHIGQQYPNLPAANRERQITDELTKAYQSGSYTFRLGQFQGQTIDVNQQINAASSQFKAFFQGPDGKNYMPDIDPYYWWRYVENIVNTGHIGDEVRNGIEWDNLQFAPIGRGIAPQDTFYPKIVAGFYKIGRFFNGDLEIVRTLMFFPVFITALTSTCVFLIARRIAGKMAGFFAATMVGTHAVLMQRTMFGHADSDAIAIFFSVLILWLFIEAFMSRKLWVKGIFASTAGLATGLYSLVWGGWWWIFDFILISAGASLSAYLGFEILRSLLNRGEPINLAKIVKGIITSKTFAGGLISSVIYFISSGIFISLLSSFRVFIVTPLASIGFRTIKTPVVDQAAPNVLRTVAELNEGTMAQAINQIGSSLFYFAVFGIALILIRMAYDAIVVIKKKKNNPRIMHDLFLTAVLVIWLAATLYSVTKGIRFVLLIIPAFSIAFGAVFGILSQIVTEWINKEFKVNKLAISAILFFVFFMVFPGLTLNSGVVQASKNVVANDVPLVNDAWYTALKTIEENSQEDAIITSWWDFGHHFKALSGRAVTFDGTTQLSPQAHWVGRMFMTNSEREAIGILRMLNCGAYFGGDEIRKEAKDIVHTYDIMKIIILMDRNNAREYLQSIGFTQATINTTLDYTHCDPPESFVIASEDMIGKSGVWAHFGGWNFTKANIWNTVGRTAKDDAIEYMKTRYQMSDAEAESIHNQMRSISDDRAADSWISPWPGISGAREGCGLNGETLQCSDGMIIDLDTYDAYYPSAQGNVHPVSIAYATEDGQIRKRTFENNTIPQQLSVALVPQGSGYYRIASSPELVDSMFVRLFYYNGHGLKHFKFVARQLGLTGTDIWVWQVDWDGNQENIVPELRKKTIVSTGDSVTLNYIGYLENGSVFDTTIRGTEVKSNTEFSDELTYRPFTFAAGRGEVVPGFDLGVINTEIGSEKIITVQPEQGYTDPLHPLFNQTMIFRIKLIEIK